MAILNVTVTHEMFDAGAQVLRRYGLSGREEMIAAEVFSAMIKAHNLAEERAEHAPVLAAAECELEACGVPKSHREHLRQFILAVMRDHELMGA